MLLCLRSPLSRAHCAGGRIRRNTFCRAYPPKRLLILPRARCLRILTSPPCGVNYSYSPRSTTTFSPLPPPSSPRHAVAGAPYYAAMCFEERRRNPAAPIEPPASLARSITLSCCLAVPRPPPSAGRPVSSRPRTCHATLPFHVPMAALVSTRGTLNSPASGVRRGGTQGLTLPPPPPRRPLVYARIPLQTILPSTSASGRRSDGRYEPCRPHWSSNLILSS